MNEHIVSAFSNELDELNADISRMGGLAETMVSDACRAAAVSDADLAVQIVARDADVDALEAEIEKRITRLIALRQPLASDLRAVLSAFRIASDLERIGDLAKNIARRSTELGDTGSTGLPQSALRMGEAVSAQLRSVLDAFSNNDPGLAEKVWLADENIDHFYNSMFREAITYMMEDRQMIGTGAHFMFIAKNLERIGDHCTNIAELVYYTRTGRQLSVETRPKAPLIET